MDMLGVYDTTGNLLNINDLDKQYNTNGLHDFLVKHFKDKVLVVDDIGETLIPKSLQQNKKIHVTTINHDEEIFGKNYLFLLGSENTLKCNMEFKFKYLICFDTQKDHKSYGQVPIVNLYRGYDTHPKRMYTDYLGNEELIVYKVQKLFGTAI